MNEEDIVTPVRFRRQAQVKEVRHLAYRFKLEVIGVHATPVERVIFLDDIRKYEDT